MNSLKRFYLLGAEAADRRVAAALAPPSLAAADRYLKASVLVTAIDHITIRLRQWWLATEAMRLCSAIGEDLAGEPVAVRRQALAVLILTAVAFHLGLTWFHGAPLDAFRMIIPTMAALFAAALLAGNRASGPTS